MVRLVALAIALVPLSVTPAAAEKPAACGSFAVLCQPGKTFDYELKLKEGASTKKPQLRVQAVTAVGGAQLVELQLLINGKALVKVDTDLDWGPKLWLAVTKAGVYRVWGVKGKAPTAAAVSTRIKGKPDWSTTRPTKKCKHVEATEMDTSEDAPADQGGKFHPCTEDVGGRPATCQVLKESAAEYREVMECFDPDRGIVLLHAEGMVGDSTLTLKAAGPGGKAAPDAPPGAAPPPKAEPAPPPAPPDKTAGEAAVVKASLVELAAKLKAGDLKYIQQRVKLPFHLAWLSDGNDQKAKLRKAADVAKRVRIEEGLLKLLASGRNVEQVRAGGCEMDGKLVPDLGPLVLVLKGARATVTAPPSFCGGQADHSVVYELARDLKGAWRLASQGFVTAAVPVK